MSEQATHAYCPACKQESAIDRRGRCLWCEGETEVRQQRKRGGWKRHDLRGSKYTEPQLRGMHVAHMKGLSLNELARQTFRQVGYGSPGSACAAISREWKRLGLAPRDRIEVTVAVSTKHGRKRRGQSATAERAYRRWMRDQRGWRSLQGPGRPRCAGVKRQPPGQGEPCNRPAMEGSDYCNAHDPKLELARQAHLGKVRARQKREPSIPAAPLIAWMQRRRDELGTARALSEEIGLNYTLTCRYLKGTDSNGQPKETIQRATAARLITAAGERFENVYGVELATEQAVAA